MDAKVDNYGYDLIAEIVSLTGLPERESTKLLINIIKKAQLDPQNLKMEDLRSALKDYILSLTYQANKNL